MLRIAADQVLAWRMRRQLLEPRTSADPRQIVSRLCGVQAQVASAAELAIAVRQLEPDLATIRRALADRRLVKTWAMRGTLHLVDVSDAAAGLALVGAARSWERPAWRRAFGVSETDMAALVEAVRGALEDRVLTREQLIDEVVERTAARHLEAQLRSGWGAVLKPLAWMGHLCYGPSEGNRVTFTRPDTWLPAWPGLPEPLDAARVVIPAYLSAYGPATAAAFDRWLTRGATRKRVLREWFAALADALAVVEVEGEPRYVLASDLDGLAATPASAAVRLLPAFDQYILGPGTGDTQIVAAPRRREVSRAAGWISPVVLANGRAVGVWSLEKADLGIEIFGEAAAVSHAELRAEAERIGATLGVPARVCIRRRGS